MKKQKISLKNWFEYRLRHVVAEDYDFNSLEDFEDYKEEIVEEILMI